MSEKNISSPPSTPESSPDSTPPLRPSSVLPTSPQRGHTKYYPECPEFKFNIGPIKKIEFVQQ
tara:strand:+ start:1148 stop:1336 length:189 start_codon:yes stop_codon:yes gene_type:complete